MGGSLARAVRNRWPTVRIHGVDTDPATLDAARSEGVVDSTSEPDAPLPRDLDLIVFATHTSGTVHLFRTAVSDASEHAVVMDLSSLKGPTLDAARDAGFVERYVGAHPITGGEFSGFGASHDHLYVDAPVWLVADERVPSETRARVERFWTELGSPVTWTPVGPHDAEMILASHLPQLIANALARVLEEGGLSRGQLGPGGRDMTRLAGSGPDMWVEIFEWVGPEIADWLAAVGSEIGRIEAWCRSGEFERVRTLMAETRRWKETE